MKARRGDKLPARHIAILKYGFLCIVYVYSIFPTVCTALHIFGDLLVVYGKKCNPEQKHSACYTLLVVLYWHLLVNTLYSHQLKMALKGSWKISLTAFSLSPIFASLNFTTKFYSKFYFWIFRSLIDCVHWFKWEISFLRARTGFLTQVLCLIRVLKRLWGVFSDKW